MNAHHSREHTNPHTNDHASVFGDGYEHTDSDGARERKNTDTVSTGIDALDTALDTGFNPGALVLLNIDSATQTMTLVHALLRDNTHRHPVYNSTIRDTQTLAHAFTEHVLADTHDTNTGTGDESTRTRTQPNTNNSRATDASVPQITDVSPTPEFTRPKTTCVTENTVDEREKDGEQTRVPDDSVRIARTTTLHNTVSVIQDTTTTSPNTQTRNDTLDKKHAPEHPATDLVIIDTISTFETPQPAANSSSSDPGGGNANKHEYITFLNTLKQIQRETGVVIVLVRHSNATTATGSANAGGRSNQSTTSPCGFEHVTDSFCDVVLSLGVADTSTGVETRARVQKNVTGSVPDTSYKLAFDDDGSIHVDTSRDIS